MYKLEFIDLDDSTEVFPVECGSLSILLDTTMFGDRTGHNVTKFMDYNSYEENDELDEEEIKFKVMLTGSIDYKAFKGFIRGRNRNFLLRVTQGSNKPRVALCKHYNEQLQPIGATEYGAWEFSVVRCTRWIEIESVGFNLSSESGNTDGFSNSDTLLDGYTFTDNFVFGESAQTIESFIVDLPYNDGDKYAYLRVNIDNWLNEFGYGLNDSYTDTYESFFCPSGVVYSGVESLVIDSHPLFRKIELTNYSTGDKINVQGLRDFNRRTYLRVPLGDNYIEFANVRAGSMILYKQFRMPW